MQKIKKNLSSIEKKFQTLKQIHKNSQVPTKIGQVAEIMTYGVINEQQVDEYLQTAKTADESINDQNWLDMSIQSMILFFDKVIKHRKLKAPQEGANKQRRNILSWQKIKTKMSNKQAHQNPYKPKRTGQGILQNSQGDFTAGTMNFGSEANLLSHINEKDGEQEASQLQEEQFCEIMDALKLDGQQTLKYKSKKSLQDQLISDLPSEFSNFPPEQRYIFLRTSYNNSKTALQKKFDMIYNHYKKLMYIKKETFKRNQDLMLDLKTFLKYYREFQIAKKYKVSQATNHFKKLALNGLWLNNQNFFLLHYLLVEIISNKEEIQTQKNIKLQTSEKQDNQKNLQQKQFKRQLTKSIKILMQNILKLKELGEIISDEKMKKLFNDNRGNSVIKKIVEVHSGFVKQDILERLKERVQQKKKKNSPTKRLKSSSVKLKTLSPEKKSEFKEQFKAIKADPSFRSIYKQLLLPNTGLGELKKTSVYSSLQLLSMHKEKQRLRQLINQDENQNYLQAYFKKQKILNSLFKSSEPVSKTSSPIHKNKQFELNNYKSTLPILQKNQSYVQKSLSLPRMKFT